jgi:DedD protein
MARAISDEELHLKKRARRRLIGAIILVTAVVVALPMVLDSEPKTESQDISIRIPEPDSGAFTPKAVPKPPAAAAKPRAKPESAATAPVQKSPATPPPPAPKPDARAVPTAKVQKPAAETQQKTTAASAAIKPATGTDKPPEFVLQVIALSDAERAKQMRQQISAAGIQAYTEVVSTEKGDVTRVRVGPFASREAADKALGQLKGIGLDGTVISR